MRARDYFLGKRIAVIGMGPHGEMLSDIRFMVKANALVSVYDLRSEARLVEHLPALRSLGLANQVLGHIPADDLLDMDLILLSHDYPRESTFLEEPARQGIDIEYPESLFLKLAPPMTVIGVMGACGKSTVISMLSPLLEAACAKEGAQACFSIDPELHDGILSHLKKAKSGDLAIMRIVSRMMHEISSLRFSPQIAVFTSMPMGRFVRSPFEIIGNQTYNNYVIGSDGIIDAVRTSGFQSKAKMIRTKGSNVPDNWLPHARTPYDKENAALALEVARIFKVPDDAAEPILYKWKPLKGHLEFVKKVNGVDFINDSSSTTPAAAMLSLQALSANRDIVAIFGGADHGADLSGFYPVLKERAHTAVILPGSGTLRERKAMLSLEGVHMLSAPSLEEAVRLALDSAKKGDKVLFSPAFEAGGADSSKKDRSERFVRAVRAL